MQRKCIICKNKQPSFGLPTDKNAKYCGDCKTKDMIDLKHPKCIVCKTKQPFSDYLLIKGLNIAEIVEKMV